MDTAGQSPSLTARGPMRLGFGWHLTLWLAIGTVVTVAVAALLWVALATPSLSDLAGFPVQDRYALVKIALTVTAGVGGIVALTVAYRRQRLGEADHRRQDVAADRDQARFLNEWFTQAAEQLGHESPAVRLAGVYAMAALADAWLEQRAMCIDVLCAYLRMPYESGSGSPGWREGEREVRWSILAAIRERLQPGAAVSWQGHDFDFTGATFDGGDLNNAIFSGGHVRFKRCVFCGERTDFAGAVLSGAHVEFNESEFRDGEVNFTSATFSAGTIAFDRAAFTGSTVWFDEALFSGAFVLFLRAAFVGGKIWFVNARFRGGQVHFSESVFDTDAEVHFRLATCSGGVVNFGVACLLGRQIFRQTSFAQTDFHFEPARFRCAPFDLSELRVEPGSAAFQGLPGRSTRDRPN
jgi:hypothetical protein